MITLPADLTTNIGTFFTEQINSPIGEFVAIIAGIALIFIFVEIITGHK